jgi:hypothetical protein
MPATTSTIYDHVSRIEFEYHPDSSGPSFSFLRLLIYSEPRSSGESQKQIRSHTISFFPHNAESADHLHNIFLSLGWLADKPPTIPEQETS